MATVYGNGDDDLGSQDKLGKEDSFQSPRAIEIREWVLDVIVPALIDKFMKRERSSSNQKESER